MIVLTDGHMGLFRAACEEAKVCREMRETGLITPNELREMLKGVRKRAGLPDDEIKVPHLKIQKCPKCRGNFELACDEEGKANTLYVYCCPSGPIVSIYVQCPHCDYQEFIKKD